eukprot:12688667-Alexandrium_andersonii.AAC.1
MPWQWGHEISGPDASAGANKQGGGGGGCWAGPAKDARGGSGGNAAGSRWSPGKWGNASRPPSRCGGDAATSAAPFLPLPPIPLPCSRPWPLALSLLLPLRAKGGGCAGGVARSGRCRQGGLGSDEEGGAPGELLREESWGRKAKQDP